MACRTCKMHKKQNKEHFYFSFKNGINLTSSLIVTFGYFNTTTVFFFLDSSSLLPGEDAENRIRIDDITHLTTQGCQRKKLNKECPRNFKSYFKNDLIALKYKLMVIELLIFKNNSARTQFIIKHRPTPVIFSISCYVWINGLTHILTNLLR